MKEITGHLTMLGSGTTINNSLGKSFVKFNTIEIGGQVLQNIRTARALEDFVSRGLGSEVTLYLRGKFLIGVKLADGKVYYWKRGYTVVVFCVVGGLLLGAMLGAGAGHPIAGVLILWVLYGLIFKSDLLRVLVDQPELAAMGGVPLKS